MSGYTPSLEQLIEQFARLPSIGKKSAQRLAFHVLNMSDADAQRFTETILNARKSIKRCKICCNLTDGEVCGVCSSQSRDKSTICVVEDPRDVIAIERMLEDKSEEKIETFNLGTGIGLSVKELISAFERAIGVKVPHKIVGRRVGDIEKVWANPEYANNVLGWKAEVPIEDTMRSAWAWQCRLRERGIM